MVCNMDNKMHSSSSFNEFNVSKTLGNNHHFLKLSLSWTFLSTSSRLSTSTTSISTSLSSSDWSWHGSMSSWCGSTSKRASSGTFSTRRRRRRSGCPKYAWSLQRISNQLRGSTKHGWFVFLSPLQGGRGCHYLCLEAGGGKEWHLSQQDRQVSLLPGGGEPPQLWERLQRGVLLQLYLWMVNNRLFKMCVFLVTWILL